MTMIPSRWLLRTALLLVIVSPRPAHTQEQASDADPIVATVGGQTFRLSDVEQRWRELDPSMYVRVIQAAFEGRERALSNLIDEYLLEREAKKRGITVERLLNVELPNRMLETDAPVQDDPDQDDREILSGTLAAASSRGDALRRYLEDLRKSSPDLSIRFDPPRQNVRALLDDRVMGPETARVEIVEYGDFQCPICKQVEPVIKRLLSRYKDQVRFVWKDYPLPTHPDAQPAAEAARCVTEPARFWSYHDKLFDNQKALSKSKLKEYAKQVGVDVAAFNACLDKGTYRERVKASIAEGGRYGVGGTPTFFINGRIVAGAMPYEVFEEIVRDELLRNPAPADRPKP
jgi:predicted DsbA family dithiol-disulfide isomerase